MSRALDIAIAALVLVVSAPLQGLAALAIKLESRGPVFYRQRRVGKDGVPFELWKLRTMVRGAESTGAGIYVLEGDPRITRVGRLLRRYSLDDCRTSSMSCAGAGDRGPAADGEGAG